MTSRARSQRLWRDVRLSCKNHYVHVRHASWEYEKRHYNWNSSIVDTITKQFKYLQHVLQRDTHAQMRITQKLRTSFRFRLYSTLAAQLEKKSLCTCFYFLFIIIVITTSCCCCLFLVSLFIWRARATASTDNNRTHFKNGIRLFLIFSIVQTTIQTEWEREKLDFVFVCINFKMKKKFAFFRFCIVRYKWEWNK